MPDDIPTKFDPAMANQTIVDSTKAAEQASIDSAKKLAEAGSRFPEAAKGDPWEWTKALNRRAKKLAGRFKIVRRPPDLARLSPGSRLPPGAPGLAQYEAERAAASPAAARSSRASRLGWRGGLALGVAGLLVGWAAFETIEWAFERAHGKMGEASDLSKYLPQQNRVAWISAPYRRISRDASDPHYEPNVFSDDITLDSPLDGATVLGISLQGLPPLFGNSTDMNRLGEGNSDWLCEPFGGYLICRSMGSDPLVKGAPSVITLQFHLPADEMKKYLKFASGSRRVYVVVPER